MLSIFQSLSAGATLLLIFLIFTNPKESNRKGNLWLGVFLLCVFFLMLDDLLLSTHLYHRYPHLIGFVPVFSLLAPSCLYFSISYFVIPNKKWKITDLKHFSFLLLFLLLRIPFFLQSGEAKIKEEFGNTEDDSVWLLLLIICCFAQIFVYWFLSYKKLKKHERNTALFSAANQDIQLKWLQHFCFVYLIMVSLWFLSVLFPQSSILDFSYFVYFAGAFLLAYYATRQEEVFPTNKQEKKEIELFISASEKAPKEKSSLLTKDELTLYKTRLLKLMEEEKPYLNNQLNLPQLAHLLALTTHQLSYLLNTALDINFSSFINKYRAEEAKKLLADAKKEHYSMLQIAYEAGYNSKTVFNTHFKKASGMSPSTFRRQHLA